MRRDPSQVSDRVVRPVRSSLPFLLTSSQLDKTNRHRQSRHRAQTIGAGSLRTSALHAKPCHPPFLTWRRRRMVAAMALPPLLQYDAPCTYHPLLLPRFILCLIDCSRCTLRHRLLPLGSPSPPHRPLLCNHRPIQPPPRRRPRLELAVHAGRLHPSVRLPTAGAGPLGFPSYQGRMGAQSIGSQRGT